MTSTPEIRIDPEFAALIPPLLPDEIQGLEVSLLAEGCHDALTVWNGVLLDGHSRHKICTAHGIPFDVREVTGVEDRDAAKRWIILNQFARRNLTMYQRTELAIKLKPIIAAKAKERMLSGKKQDGNGRGNESGKTPGTKPTVDPVNQMNTGSKTRDELAKKAGVSPATITKAEFLDKHADEETKAKLRSGKIKITTAVKEIKTKQAAASGKPAPKPSAKKPRKIACECGHIWTPVCPRCKRPYS